MPKFVISSLYLFIFLTFSSTNAIQFNITVVEPQKEIPYLPLVPLYVRVDGILKSDECYSVYLDGTFSGVVCEQHSIIDVVPAPGVHLLDFIPNYLPSSHGKLQYEFRVSEPSGDRLPAHVSKDGWSIDLPDFIDAYHNFWHSNNIWMKTTWRGVRAEKSPSDMWNYQEILHSLKPTVVLEIGVRFGGATLFYSDVMKTVHRDGTRYRILSVDIDRDAIDKQVFQEPHVEVLIAPSASATAARRLAAVRAEFPGPMFAILDADHGKDNVTLELQTVSPHLQPGDYLIVEDSNLDGHPVAPGWGPSPYDAVTEFHAYNRRLLDRDIHRELKYGWTQAPAGFLRRTGWQGAIYFPLKENPYAHL